MWFTNNYAGTNSTTNIHGISQNLEYDIQYTSLLTEKEETKYFTDFIYANDTEVADYNTLAISTRNTHN